MCVYLKIDNAQVTIIKKILPYLIIDKNLDQFYDIMHGVCQLLFKKSVRMYKYKDAVKNKNIWYDDEDGKEYWSLIKSTTCQRTIKPNISTQRFAEYFPR